MMTSAQPPGPPLAPTTAGDGSGSSTLSWEGDKMFNIYIYDYCFKRGFRKTARELLIEADIPADSTPPINARQGLLFEWWSVFWVLFTAKANGQGPEDAMIYTQHQAAQAASRQQRQGQTQAPMRPMNGMPPNQRFNGPVPNGLPPPGAPGFAGPQMNGVPSQNYQMIPGQRPPGPQRTNGPFQGDGQPPATQQGGQPPQMLNRGMLPPNGGPGPQGQTPNSFQPMARPPSRTATPGAIMATQSPQLMNRQLGDTNSELSKIPQALMNGLKQEIGLGDKDLQAFTLEEKQRLINQFRRRQQVQRPPNAAAGPSNPMMPPQQQQQQQQQQQRNAAGRPTKRNSTSPGDEPEPAPTGSSPPDRKRLRRSPMEQSQMVPMPYPQVPQQPPPGQPGPGHMNGPPNPMMRGPPGPPGPPQNGGFNPGGPGGMGAPPPMMNPMMGMNQQPLGPGPMGMGGMMTAQMQMHGMQNRDPNQYRQSMQMHGGRMMPGGPGPGPAPGMGPNAGSPAADPASQFNPQFNPGAQNVRMAPPPQGLPGQQQKPMGMLPPPSPSMSKDGQPQKDGVKPDGSPHNNNTPTNPPAIPPGPPGQQPQAPGTAPATPITTNAPPPTLNPSAMDSGLLGTNDMPFDMNFINSVASSLDDFDASMFRPDGDINFERDFGQWFSPDDAIGGGLDMGK